MREDSSYGGSWSPGPPGGPGGPGGQGSGEAAPQRRPRRWRTSLLSHLSVAVLAAAASAGLVLGLDQPAANSVAVTVPGATAVPSPGPAVAAAGALTASREQKIVDKVLPGLVTINTTLPYYGERAAGTGMVINPDGLVLTNNHVIEGSSKITATVISTGKVYPVTVVGYDKARDVALLQMHKAAGLSTVPIGNSSALRVGDAVLALGNAEGRDTIIPAAGQVTALDQTVTATGEGQPAIEETLHGMIEDNADIVPGDSGGPLAGAGGSVVGMDTAGNDVTGATQPSVQGYAIPIDTALSIARTIAAGHASSAITIGYPPFLGIFVGTSSSSSPQVQAEQQQAQSGFSDGFGGFGGFGGPGSQGSAPSCYTSDTGLGVPSAIAPASSGTLIDGTICGSPAANAGITAGSVITAISGHAIGSPADLRSVLAAYRPGQAISVTWVGLSGHSMTRTITLAAGPPQ